MAKVASFPVFAKALRTCPRVNWLKTSQKFVGFCDGHKGVSPTHTHTKGGGSTNQNLSISLTCSISISLYLFFVIFQAKTSAFSLANGNMETI